MQAGLRLCCSQTSENRFSCVMAIYKSVAGLRITMCIFIYQLLIIQSSDNSKKIFWREWSILDLSRRFICLIVTVDAHYSLKWATTWKGALGTSADKESLGRFTNLSKFEEQIAFVASVRLSIMPVMSAKYLDYIRLLISILWGSAVAQW